MNRREFLRRLAISSGLGAVAVSGLIVLVEKFNSSSIANQLPSLTLNQPQNQTIASTAPVSTTGSSGTSSQSSSIPTGYIYLAPLSALAGKSYAYFTHPNFGSSILINYGGNWRAFSAVCTHAGCTVNFTGSQLYCPCHSGYFSATNGSVISGPPPTRLQEYGVVSANGAVYVGTTVIN